MFRIGLKFPCNGLNRVSKIKKHGPSRLYLSTRCYETRTRVKCEPDWRFFKDVKLTSRVSGHRYSTDSSKSEKSRGGGGVLITLTAVAIGASGLLYYAKNNPEFRATLEGWVPGTDKTIQIIFQEEKTYFEFIRSYFESLKQSIVTAIFGESSEKPGQPFGKTIDCTNLEDYIPPKPAFVPLVDKKEPPNNEPYTEIRLSKGDSVEVVADKPAPPAKDVPEELIPESLVELETLCGQTASKVIQAYQKASCAIQDYNKDVIKVLENVDGADSAVWNRLKKATEKRTKAIEEAEVHKAEASESLKKMLYLIDDPKLDAPSHMKTAARRNVKKILSDVDEAKKNYESELQHGSVTERYWKEVKAARESLEEELRILFADININEKKLAVDEDSFDLFVLHMSNKVNNLQKELAKLRTVYETRLKTALKAVGDTASQAQLDALVCLELDKEKLILEEELSKKLLEEQKKFDDEMRRQLKLQEQVHTDHLQETLAVKEQEAERNLNRVLNEQSEADGLKYKSQLATIVGRLRGLEAALKARIEEERGASNAQILWSACQALARAMKATAAGTCADKVIRPLESEIKAVTKAAPKEDPLVLAAIQGIPEEAAKRGVFPEDILRARFLKVEEVARRLAMVPAEGASLPIYLLSYLQNFLMIKNVRNISKWEMEDNPIDVNSLTTFDILRRARFWLDRGDFKMALRYMNLLKGAPRSVARDWMNETRILLETQQAVDTLLAYAGAIGLVFLGAGDAK